MSKPYIHTTTIVKPRKGNWQVLIADNTETAAFKDKVIIYFN